VRHDVPGTISDKTVRTGNAIWWGLCPCTLKALHSIRKSQYSVNSYNR